MTDLFRLLDRLEPPQDGESPVRHRTGTVDAVNSDGTVDLDLGGVVVDSVAVLEGPILAGGDEVQVAVWRGDLLVLGRRASQNGNNSTALARTVIAGNTFGTGEAVRATATLSIPANWTTYDIEARVAAYFADTGTVTAPRSITGRIKLTGTGGTLFLGSALVTSIDAGAPNDRPILAHEGYLEGLSATGSVPVVYTLQLSGDNNQVSVVNGGLIATAYRTS